MGLKCHHFYAATATKPEPFDAGYCWWNDFDLVFLGKEIGVRIRENLWKMEKLSRMASGSLLPD
jgi:hypothetical protein